MWEEASAYIGIPMALFFWREGSPGNSLEVPRLHPDLIDVSVRIDDITDPRQPARIRCRRPMMKLVATAMGWRKRCVPRPDAGKLGRKISQPVSLDRLGELIETMGFGAMILSENCLGRMTPMWEVDH